jgi:hypothetical protein
LSIKALTCHIAFVTVISILTKTLEAKTGAALDGGMAEKNNLQVGGEGILVLLISLEECEVFRRALGLVWPFHAPLEGLRTVLDLVPVTQG